MLDQTHISTNRSAIRSTSTSRIPVSPMIRRHRSLSALDLHRRQQQHVWSSSASSCCSYSHSPSSSLLLMRKSKNNQFKSNPYVGWFRHSPDTTMVKRTLFPRNPATTTAKINVKKQFSSLKPQEELPVWKKQQQVLLMSNVLMRNDGAGMSLLRRRLASDQDLVAKFLEEESMLPKDVSCCFNYKNDKQEYRVRQLTELLSGRLRGGGNTTGSSILPLDPHDYRGHGKDNDLHHHHDDEPLSSSTAHLLTRFAYWLLLPFQDDEEPEEQDDDEDGNDTDERGHHLQGHVDTTKNILSSSSACFSEGDDDNDSLDDYDYDPSTNGNNHNSLLSPPPTAAVDIGISSQAEAYYAHYSQHPHHQHGHYSQQQHQHHHLIVDQDLSRLDYVITQMDILRMQRNASRHLDVESIYQLPTQTYYSNKTKKNPVEANNNAAMEHHHHHHHESLSSCTISAQDDDCRDGHDESTRNHQYRVVEEEASITSTTAEAAATAEGWSWMLIPEDNKAQCSSSFCSSGASSLDVGQGTTNTNKDQDSCRRQEHDGHDKDDDVGDGDNRLEQEQQQQQEQQDEEEQHACVICLEHFVDGDRLRVLPCHHKFHVGCIDKWLSGSSSYQDCHTAGCPTCKKRPHVILSGFHNDNQEGATMTAAAAAAGDWSSHSDGSLPGWAFAQLGSVMAAASADIAHHQ